MIYLDPMFPARKSSAAVRGEMQQLQRFLGADQDAFELLELALAAGVPRVVLKRPPKGDWQGPVKPSHIVGSRTAQYEVYLR